MKKNPKTLALLSCLTIAILVLCQSCTPLLDTRSDKEKMLDFFLNHEAMLTPLMEEAKGHYLLFWGQIFIDGEAVNRNEASKELRWAFHSGLESINGKAPGGEVTFGFTWTKDPLEGHILLVYHPMNVPPERWAADPSLELVEESENLWRWTGCGIGGIGYIIVERLQENLFYEEVYWPT